MELTFVVTLHGHSWTTLSGLWATPRDLALFMSITRMDSPDILKHQPCGSRAS
uniref:Uncharacterized protein n=1 Tax=Arundo donax TaxID=35708 RepID=A0A0A8XPQ0_ARUDO